MSEYQEEVLTNILDLQAELRGDEPDPSAKKPKEAKASSSSDGGSDPSNLSVSEDGVTISLASRRSAAGHTVTDRIAALNERLDRLEHDLATVTRRIERIEPEPDSEAAEATETDVDAPWRSFLDLQKIVADRLDHG